MSDAIINLTIDQASTIQIEGEHGTPLHDALLVAGFRLCDLDELAARSDVRELYSRGVATGQSKIRQQLARAAESGNVSAMEALKLMQDPDKAERDGDQPPVPKESRAEMDARYRRWKADFDRRWEVFRELSEVDLDA